MRLHVPGHIRSYVVRLVRISKDFMIEFDNSVNYTFFQKKNTFQHWFQNRRAKSRREFKEAHSASIGKTNPSSQFGLPVGRPRPPQFPVSHARHLEHKFLTVQSNRSDQLFRLSPSTVNHPSTFKSSQFRSYRSFQIPIFHSDQFNRRCLSSNTSIRCIKIKILLFKSSHHLCKVSHTFPLSL